LWEESRVDDQGAGFRFLVREIISGPTELEEAVPAQAVTLSCLPDIGGGGEFWCGQLAQPVKHRIGEAVDAHRYRADYVDHDESGPFFWAYYIVLRLTILRRSARALRASSSMWPMWST